MANGPTIKGVMYVGLSVRDVRRSTAWYRELLDMEIERENYGGSAWPSDWDEVLLRHPASGILIGLVQHPSNPGDPFSEFRTGLDHLEFEVEGSEQLDGWEERLRSLGIAYSRKQAHIIAFRDPDNIQLEFFYPQTPLTG
jgi:catechol 2,3-dioxygenase-like lactoylglutathione lyase family enzyme